MGAKNNEFVSRGQLFCSFLRALLSAFIMVGCMICHICRMSDDSEITTGCPLIFLTNSLQEACFSPFSAFYVDMSYMSYVCMSDDSEIIDHSKVST